MFANNNNSKHYDRVRNLSYSDSSSSSSSDDDDDDIPNIATRHSGHNNGNNRHHQHHRNHRPDNEDFIQREIRQQQQLMMRQQDEGLEMLGESATRLSQISLGIHEELGQQMKMLDALEDDLDTATTNLGLVTMKTKELIQKSGGKRNFILMVVLTLIVIVLLFLIIYT
ncbi:hypothetical protein ACHAWU_007416 [Discostella pseudostelligera]|uniref:t-SNARE coiled-coil homology domain-containing protein n=1 Tax=Discostella pseudostelligera TaxID=259834 RepID=A0ABD3MCY1_9STRA